MKIMGIYNVNVLRCLACVVESKEKIKLTEVPKESRKDKWYSFIELHDRTTLYAMLQSQ